MSSSEKAFLVDDAAPVNWIGDVVDVAGLSVVLDGAAPTLSPSSTKLAQVMRVVLAK